VYLLLLETPYSHPVPSKVKEEGLHSGNYGFQI